MLKDVVEQKVESITNSINERLLILSPRVFLKLHACRRKYKIVMLAIRQSILNRPKYAINLNKLTVLQSDRSSWTQVEQSSSSMIFNLKNGVKPPVVSYDIAIINTQQ